MRGARSGSAGHEDRHRVEVVHRDAEEALDLGRVQVHRHDAVGAGDLDRVGEDARADRDARLVLLSPLP